MIKLLSRQLTALRLVNLSSAIFFFNDTATTEIYTLSLHDALPIYRVPHPAGRRHDHQHRRPRRCLPHPGGGGDRSEEHTSALQSRQYLVCRLLLDKNTPFTPHIQLHQPPNTSRPPN